MKTKNAPAKKSSSHPAGGGEGLRRIKCACASCNCMVDIDTGVRKKNLVYCSRACLTECSFEECNCDHDGCRP